MSFGHFHSIEACCISLSLPLPLDLCRLAPPRSARPSELSLLGLHPSLGLACISACAYVVSGSPVYRPSVCADYSALKLNKCDPQQICPLRWIRICKHCELGSSFLHIVCRGFPGTIRIHSQVERKRLLHYSRLGENSIHHTRTV